MCVCVCVCVCSVYMHRIYVYTSSVHYLIRNTVFTKGTFMSSCFLESIFHPKNLRVKKQTNNQALELKEISNEKNKKYLL